MFRKIIENLKTGGNGCLHKGLTILQQQNHKRANSDISKRLSEAEWGKIDGAGEIDEILAKLSDCMPIASWTERMMKLTKPEERVLEIGCGSGQTSLYLAKHGRCVTALDYAKESIDRIRLIAKIANIELTTVQADALHALPFMPDAFDVIFQAGLLEHFSQEERISMLRLWSPHAKKMISLIPNAHSLAYRLGKKIKEENGTWSYGLEMPQASLVQDFIEAGFTNVSETTIGLENALRFLPKRHYMRKAIERWHREMGDDDDLWGQGYLLVTTGDRK